MIDPQNPSDQPFLPRYRVDGFIGEGAAARIYKVVDKRSGAVRAIKALKPESNAEPSIVKRFEDEYLILRRLHHPSLPEVYDYGFTGDGNRYIVMELVEGDPLDAYFEKHREDLWLLLYEMCEVLSFIHDRDLLHLDLKPANILVKRTTAYGDEKPMVVLMDFGLSYRRDVGEERSLVGTPEYMAPEIIRGDGRLTRAADYYSLGITLYQLLTGEPPFRGDIKDVFSGHLRQEVRFQQEKTEYAELYPHILGLSKKEIADRLEAFEGFRRASAARLGGSVPKLELSYGLSAISSVGMIGKESALIDVVAWTKEIDGYVEARRKTNDEPISKRTVDSLTKTVQIREQTNLESSSLTRELLSEIEERDFPRVSTVKSPPRVYALSGPYGYGKTYLVDKLIELKRLGRWTFWRLTSGSSGNIVNDYESSLSGREITPRRSGFIDPQSAVIDQYITAWDRLNGNGQKAGSILVVDNFEDLDDEQRGFLDYVSKRMEIDDSGFDTAIVYVIVVGTHPKLEDIAADIFGMRQVISHALSPLKEPEIHDTIDRLRGRHVTSNDRRNLEGFLSRFREEPGAIPAALEDMITRGFLAYSNGQWRFDSSDAHQHPEAISSLSEYYKELPYQLPDHAREVLDWIVCHHGEIQVHRIAEISGIPLPDVFKAIDTIAPYRIVEIHAASEHPSVGLFRERVQQSLYEVISIPRRDYIHDTYIRAYEDLTSSLDIGDANLHTSALRQLMHQYSATGAFRLLLSNIIRVIRNLVSRRQYFELRSFCNESLAMLFDLKRGEKPSRVESVRRYVLKQLIEANWLLDDYDTVKYVTQKHYGRRYHDIPLAIAFKYCLSLIFHNEYDAASSVAEAIKRRFPGRKSQAYNTASIVETNVLIQTGRFQDALSLIMQVENNEHVLAEYQRCRLYSSFLLIFEHLADEEGISKYVPLLEDITIRNGFHHEFQFCLLAPFNIAFNKSLLSECKRTARKAISIASRARSYRRLVDWYFRASAVYYEDGSYDRAVKYVNKALPLAERLGLADEIASLVTRLAMNYLNAGAFGNAIVHIERALSIWSKDYNVNAGAVVYLFAFEAHLVANSRHVDTYYKRATAYMKRHSEVQRWGYYWHLVGMYKLRNREMISAANAFKKSRRMYDNEGAPDDAVRSGLKEIIALLGIGHNIEASRLIAQLTNRLKGLESTNIRAEYWAVKLSYQYHRRANRSVLKRHLKLCEEAFVGAEEVPVLLNTEKIIIRTKARVGDVSGAQKVFRTRLKRIKSILSNMPNRDYAEDFLNDYDEQLLMQEFRLLEKKGARTSVPR